MTRPTEEELVTALRDAQRGLDDAVWHMHERTRYARALQARGWTQQRIAKEVGLTRQAVAKWLNGAS